MDEAAYFLDTSAFRAIPATKLATFTPRERPWVSPFCFWELLKHLDDDEGFARVKGRLMKFPYVSVLDHDPWASVALRVVSSDDPVHKRPTDSSLIYGILAALRDSVTLTEFYAKYAKDDQGQVRQIDGCVARVKHVLAADEQRFQVYVAQIMSAVREGSVSLTSLEDRHQGTLDIVNAWMIQLHDRVEDVPQAKERVIRQTYVYSSYVLQLAADLLRRQADVMPRDYEDAMFCLHLSLDQPIVAVTNDRLMNRRLYNTLTDLSALHDEHFLHQLRVVDSTAVQGS